MEKKILGFNRIKGECCPVLEVMASKMTQKELKETKKELDRFGFKYEKIDSESIVAYLSFGYFTEEHIIETINKLKESGWD